VWPTLEAFESFEVSNGYQSLLTGYSAVEFELNSPLFMHWARLQGFRKG
jgi:hypothetical protein